MILSEYTRNELKSEVHDVGIGFGRKYQVKLYVNGRLFKEEPFTNEEIADAYAEDFVLGAMGSGTPGLLTE
jgi:Holliday junction resolvasome RuvABC endonuclease subunit